MKPVTVSIEVPQSPEEVFDHLDVLANHEAFTDHFLVDWETSGPERGVGARARMRVKKPGPEDWLEMEVIESERPRRNVERATGAKGKRLTQGTYELAPLRRRHLDQLRARLARGAEGRAPDRPDHAGRSPELKREVAAPAGGTAGASARRSPRPDAPRAGPSRP